MMHFVGTSVCVYVCVHVRVRACMVKFRNLLSNVLLCSFLLLLTDIFLLLDDDGKEMCGVSHRCYIFYFFIV